MGFVICYKFLSTICHNRTFFFWLLLQLSGTNLVTHLDQSPIFEWCVVRCRSTVDIRIDTTKTCVTIHIFMINSINIRHMNARRNGSVQFSTSSKTHTILMIQITSDDMHGHRVIDITNGHFIHAGPFKGTGVFIYLSDDMHM